MEARQPLVPPAWAGFLLTLMGFLAFAGSYFLLPVVAAACFDDCPTAYFTAWDMSMRALSLLPVTVGQSLFYVLVLVLVLCYLPLLAAVTVLAGSIAYLIRPQRTFATWNHRIWLAGTIVLGIAFLFLFFPFIHPYIGYAGMVFGYGLLWGGNQYSSQRNLE